MSAQKSLGRSAANNDLNGPPSGEDESRSPDYEAWEGLDESPKSVFVQVALALLHRSMADIAVVIAQLGLTVLACAIVKYGGGGMPPPQPMICVLILALMLGSPTFCHLYALVTRSPDHAENSDGERPA